MRGQFDKLKHLLTTSPILKIVEPYKDFVICIDACKEGLGGVLLQARNATCYESIKLKDHEKIYATHDLELETIIHALKMWHPYLIGNIFLLITNNTIIILMYLFDQQSLNIDRAR